MIWPGARLREHDARIKALEERMSAQERLLIDLMSSVRRIHDLINETNRACKATDGKIDVILALIQPKAKVGT